MRTLCNIAGNYLNPPQHINAALRFAALRSSHTINIATHLLRMRLTHPGARERNGKRLANDQ
jgi:hypothetical protein